jgi:hypothetical protein
VGQLVGPLQAGDRVVNRIEGTGQPKGALADDKGPVTPADLLQKFNALYKEGKYREAEVVAAKACELEPDNPVARAALELARKQQPSAGKRPADATLEEILNRLERLERRLEEKGK